MTDADILALFERLALEAGEVILDVYNSTIDVAVKADNSPVTLADEASERVILEGLRRELPSIPCVAEEEIASGAVPAALGSEFILVDPLDGTKEFINRRPDFTVNIALVRDGVPVIGVVYAPASGRFFSGRPGLAESADVADSVVAKRRPIGIRACGETVMVVASRSHRTPETDAYIAKFPSTDLTSIGSSLKFCLLAAGEADLYPRFGRTMEWDTAAGDAVLRAAGGTTTKVDGSPFVYGKRNQPDDSDFANPWFISRGNAPQPA